MLLLWPGWVRRQREDDSGRIGLAMFAGTNISDLSINFFFQPPIPSHSMGALLCEKQCYNLRIQGGVKSKSQILF